MASSVLAHIDPAKDTNFVSFIAISDIHHQYQLVLLYWKAFTCEREFEKEVSSASDRSLLSLLIISKHCYYCFFFLFFFFPP